MNQLREYTVAELIQDLEKFPLGLKVLIEDADTNWTIPKFRLEENAQGLWIIPCGYPEMEKAYEDPSQA